MSIVNDFKRRYREMMARTRPPGIDPRDLADMVEMLDTRMEVLLALGEAKGKAEALLGVLAARGLTVSEGQREQVLACQDLGALDRWIVLAATAESVESVLG